MNMESDPRNGDIIVKLPTYISLALGSAVVRSLLGELPMDGTTSDIWDAIGLTPGTLGEDGWGSGSRGIKTSSVGEIFERIRQLQPPEEDEGSDEGSGSDSDDGDDDSIDEDDENSGSGSEDET